MATASQKITEMRFFVLMRGALTPETVPFKGFILIGGWLTSLTSSHYANPHRVNADRCPYNAQGNGQANA